MNLLIAQLGFPFHKTELGDLLGITSVSKAGKDGSLKHTEKGCKPMGKREHATEKQGKDMNYQVTDEETLVVNMLRRGTNVSSKLHKWELQWKVPNLYAPDWQKIERWMIPNAGKNRNLRHSARKSRSTWSFGKGIWHHGGKFDPCILCEPRFIVLCVYSMETYEESRIRIFNPSLIVVASNQESVTRKKSEDILKAYTGILHCSQK